VNDLVREPSSNPHNKSNTPVKVLVVDDEEHIREILKETLELEGFQVDTAVDGEDGRKKIMAESYRVVVTDIRMPMMNGLGLLTEIKQHLPDTQVIVITGLATPEQMERAVSLGAYKCVRKPFHIKSLIKDIFEAIEAGASVKNEPSV
jgi:DNA-binding NtrC family response regulator